MRAFKLNPRFKKNTLGSLKGKTQKETYELKKIYIELFLCKIITPDTCFIFQNGNDKTPNIYSPQVFQVF